MEVIKLDNISKQTSLLDLKKALSPEQYAKMLRSFGKVFYWDAAKFYVVTDHELAKEVMKNPAFSADRSSFFISRMPNLDLRLIKDFFGIVQKMMVMSDGQQHENRRKAAALGIDGELLEYYKPIIEASIDRMIANIARQESFDFVREIAEPLPSTILADLFGIPEEDRKSFYDSSVKMTRFFGGATSYENQDGTVVNEAAVHIRQYFEKLIAERRRIPRRDFISVLLKSQSDFGLSDEEIISQAVMMLVAGQVTTTDQLAQNFYQLFEEGNLQKLVAQPDLIPTALEEFNRLDPAVSYVFRTVKKEIELGDVALKPEDVIFISVHAVNRDPAAFENPDLCDLSRSKNPHFVYGHGPHFCLGQRLARMQMQICFKKLIERLPYMRLDPDRPSLRNHYALSFSGFSQITVMTNNKI